MEVEGTSSAAATTPNEDLLRRATLILRNARQNANLSENQIEVLTTLLLKNQDVQYIDRTGAGKSASYFIATKILREDDKKNSKAIFGPTLVVCPLKSLARNQISAAGSFGLKARAYNSSLSSFEKGDVIDAINDNDVDILCVTPETLCQLNFQEKFDQFNEKFRRGKVHRWEKFCLIVIDEYHCISDWGHDFRPSYSSGLDAQSTKRWFKSCRKLATSATVTARVEKDACASILKDSTVIRGKLFRSNLHISSVSAPSLEAKKQWLLEFFEQFPATHFALIFALTKVETVKISKYLTENGFEAKAYHGDLNHEESEIVETGFVEGAIRIVVSTIALGMGFDKDDINTVIHWYTPASPIQYYQQIGRAGRRLKQCDAIILPDKGVPFRTDGQTFEAVRECVKLLCTNPLSRSEITSSLGRKNIKPKIIEAALAMAMKRKYLKEELDKIYFCKEIPQEDDDEYEAHSQNLEEEAKFMKSLFADEGCIWNRLLRSLGENPDQDECECCSHCADNGRGKVVELPMPSAQADRDMAYSWRTPGGIQVYGLGSTTDDPVVSIRRIRKVFEQYEDGIAANPPSWALTFVPGKLRQHGDNESIWRDLAVGLMLPSFSCVRSNPNVGSLTECNTQELREEVIRKKLTFDFNSIPSQRSVIVFDDAAKSGTTLDYVGSELKRKGFDKVVGFVLKFWTSEASGVDL